MISFLFFFQFLPGVLALYFLVRAAAVRRPAAAREAGRIALAIVLGAGLWLLWRSPLGWLLILQAAVTLGAAAAIERIGRQAPFCRGLATLSIGVSIGIVIIVRSQTSGAAFALCGAAVLLCHGIALVTDVLRGDATLGDPLEAAVYLVQFPVLPTGPLTRFHDFSANIAKAPTFVNLGSFTYGVRRLIIGWVKVELVAGTLASPADAIFELPLARSSAGTAWFGALCVSLSYYFWLAGYADLAIGLGRMLGFRYPENFRRPYTADSLREFWRRWSVTSITWMRDYLSLPIAGRDLPTPRLFVNIVIGFMLLGVWHGGARTVWIWALYSATWLALEAVVLGRLVDRLPRILRHLYVLLVVATGWVLLRAGTTPELSTMLKAMLGMAGGRAAVPVSRYLTLGVGTALFAAIVGAGPLVPWISRWRVTLDATTAALVMMLSACWLFAWRAVMMTRDAIAPPRRRGNP